MVHRQRPQEKSVNDTEDDGIRRDAQGQEQHGRGGETETPAVAPPASCTVTVCTRVVESQSTQYTATLCAAESLNDKSIVKLVPLNHTEATRSLAALFCNPRESDVGPQS